jgi:hypothetical protein
MIMTITNLSATVPLVVGYPLNDTLAGAAAAVIGVSMADLMFGEDRGDPAYKRLDMHVQKGEATVALAADADDATVIDAANEL